MIEYNCNDLIVFNTLTNGYNCLAVGKITDYMFDDHCEVNNIVILRTPNGATSCSHRVGYNNIKAILPMEYINKIKLIKNDFPELFI